MEFTASPTNEIVREVKKRKRQSEAIDIPLKIANTESLQTSEREQVRDRYDVFGENISMKLRYLPENQRIMAEKLFNDVLFEAECHNLDRSWKLCKTCET